MARSRYRKFTPEEVAYLRGLRRSGMTYAEISALYPGTTKDQVQKVIVASYPELKVKGTSITKMKEGGRSSAPTLPGVKVDEHPLKGFTRTAFDKVTRISPPAQSKLFFVTAASPVSEYSGTELIDGRVTGRNVNRPFWGAIQSFLSEMDAELVLLPMRAHEKPLSGQPSHYDPLLVPFKDRMASEFQLNSNLVALDSYLNPQQAKPLTGLTRLGGRSRTSLLVAHSKQDMKVIATGNGSHPRIIQCTGTCTEPEYLRNRVGRLASDQHVLGGLVVLVHGERFWAWQVQARDDGSFVVGGFSFSAMEPPRPESAEAIKLGDLHPGLEDRIALEAAFRAFKVLRPKRLFLEDWFDGRSISHHVDRSPLQKAMRKAPFRTLSEELTYARQLIAEVHEQLEPGSLLYLTASNHPDHVDQWLENGRWISDHHNFWMAHDLIARMKRESKFILDDLIDPDSNYQWLGTEDDVWVEGVQLACHGHLGVNGGKGTPGGLSEHLADGVGAHTHTPGVDGAWYTAGHTSVPRHGYNRGPSTWIPAWVNVFRGGTKQIQLIIDGSSGLEHLPVPKSQRGTT